MIWTVAIHKVKNFDLWLKFFKSQESAKERQKGGEKSYRILRTIDDPNQLILINEWEEMGKLQEFAQSEHLKEMQKKSGVVEPPVIYVSEMVEQGKV
jgi:quinol monooxygenase YgiN